MDATLKEVNIRRSVKKFFLDGLPNHNVNFERVITPGDSTVVKWMNISIENLRPAVVSNAILTIHMFTTHDYEGNDLAEMRDEVVELLEPGFIPLYDTQGSPSWQEIGAISLFFNAQSKASYAPNNAKMLYIQNVMKWASVWS